jgi:hypothetical protein
VRAVLDQHDSPDDQQQAEDHQPGERLVEQERRQHGGERNAQGAPDPVERAEREAPAQQPDQQEERRHLTHDRDGVQPRVVLRPAQRQRPGHLGGDRCTQDQPPVHRPSLAY